jgi:hypothetical protein
MQPGWTVTSATGSMRVEFSTARGVPAKPSDRQGFSAAYGTAANPPVLSECKLGEVTLSYHRRDGRGSTRFCGVAGDDLGGTSASLRHCCLLHVLRDVPA